MRLLLLPLVAALAAQAEAPRRPQAPPRFQADVSLIEVEAVVTGPDGQPALDLAAEDFELLEEGKPQAITHVSLRRSGSVPAGEAAPAAPALPAGAQLAARVPVETAPRRLVLAVDDLHLAPESLLRVRQALERFIERDLAEGDLAALITCSGTGGVLQPFTAERASLRAAVGRIGPTAAAAAGLRDLPRMPLYQASLIDQGDRLARQAAISQLQQDDPGLPPTLATAMVEGKARELVAEARRTARVALETLRTHMLLLRRLEGRKLLVLLSDGFLLDGERSGQLREVAGLGARAGVAFYTVDMRGLGGRAVAGDVEEGGRALAFDTERYRRMDLEALRHGLNALARDTGGLPLFNIGDPSAALERVLADSAVSYRIAYSPALVPRPGQFRKVELRLRRPGLQVRAFRGYLSDARPTGPPDPLREALLSLVPPADFGLELATGWLDTASGPSAVIATRLLGGTWAPERGRPVPVKLKGVIYDGAVRPVAGFDDAREVRLDPSAAEPSLTFSTQAVLKPGPHHVRVAVQAGERLATATAAFEVPAVPAAELAVSDIFLSPEDQSAPVPVRPGRSFRRAEELEFVLYVSNARSGETASTDLGFVVRVLSGEKLAGESSYEIVVPREAPAQPRVAFDRRLPLSLFPPGPHTLSVRVTDRVAQRSLERTLSFLIVE